MVKGHWSQDTWTIPYSNCAPYANTTLCAPFFRIMRYSSGKMMSLLLLLLLMDQCHKWTLMVQRGFGVQGGVFNPLQVFTFLNILDI